MIKKKQYIPLYVAVIVLILMIVALVFLLIPNKENSVYIPKKPTVKNMDVSILTSNWGSIRNIKNNNPKVEHYLFDNYYENGYSLSSPKVKKIENSLIIFNSNETKKPFISSINLDGKMEFFSDIPYKGYDSLIVEHVSKFEKEYYIIASAYKNDRQDILLITYDLNGKYKDTNKIKESFSGFINNIFAIDKKIYIINEDTDVSILEITDKKMGRTYNLDEDENDEFLNSNPIIATSYANSNYIYLLLEPSDGEDELDYEHYLYKIDVNTMKSTVLKTDGIDRNQDNGTLYIKNGKLYRLGETSVTIFNPDGVYETSIDYKNLELENVNDYKEYINKEEGIEEVTNSLAIDSILDNNDNTAIKLETAFSNIYDIIEDNKISKRYVVNRIKYQYYGTLLDTFIVGDKIYDIYSYGYDKPAILINVIG